VWKSLDYGCNRLARLPSDGLTVSDPTYRQSPPALRTRKLTVRVPRYQIGALQVLADDGRESVDAMLTRMFEELTDLNQERLSRLIPGLAEPSPGLRPKRATGPAETTDLEIIRNVLTSV